jgi:hypothetical protein
MAENNPAAPVGPNFNVDPAIWSRLTPESRAHITNLAGYMEAADQLINSGQRFTPLVPMEVLNRLPPPAPIVPIPNLDVERPPPRWPLGEPIRGPVNGTRGFGPPGRWPRI